MKEGNEFVLSRGNEPDNAPRWSEGWILIVSVMSCTAKKSGNKIMKLRSKRESVDRENIGEIERYTCYAVAAAEAAGASGAVDAAAAAVAAADADFGGLPRFFFAVGSESPPPSPSAAPSGLGFLGGRPRLRLGASSVPSSSFFSWEIC